MKLVYYKTDSDVSFKEVKEELYDNILSACMKGDNKLLTHTLEFAKANHITIELSYQEGLFCVIAAQNGYTEILKTLNNYDSSLIKNYSIDILGTAADYGKIECVEFLLAQGINPKELKGTTAYNNYHEVEEIFIKYDTEHKDTVEISGNNLILDVQY
jgi:hypothetical protein